MKSSTLIFIILLISMLSLTSCETFGPASRYQNTRMLERPFYSGADTGQMYISARFGNGRNYRERDKSYAGELSTHYSWVSKWLFASVGAYGQYGRYKLRDSAALSYYSLGGRLEAGVSGYFDNTEVSIVGLSLSSSYEGGQFFDLRSRTGQKSALSILFFNDSTERIFPRTHSITDFQSYFNIRHRFKLHQIMRVRFGLGFSTNDETATYAFADGSYQCNKHITFNINSAYPLLFDNKNGALRLNNIVAVGVTYGF